MNTREVQIATRRSRKVPKGALGGPEELWSAQENSEVPRGRGEVHREVQKKQSQAWLEETKEVRNTNPSRVLNKKTRNTGGVRTEGKDERERRGGLSLKEIQANKGS